MIDPKLTELEHRRRIKNGWTYLGSCWIKELNPNEIHESDIKRAKWWRDPSSDKSKYPKEICEQMELEATRILGPRLTIVD